MVESVGTYGRSNVRLERDLVLSAGKNKLLPRQSGSAAPRSEFGVACQRAFRLGLIRSQSCCLLAASDECLGLQPHVVQSLRIVGFIFALQTLLMTGQQRNEKVTRFRGQRGQRHLTSCR